MSVNYKLNEADLQSEFRHIVLAGNPNVGKSTVFNALTGLRQHTGNWSGKTVESAGGVYVHNGISYMLADVPGCYSLKTHSSEEGFALNTIMSKTTDGVVVVCDACCLERNLNLFFQICESRDNVVIGLNFMDVANKKGILIDTKKLSKLLGVPVLIINARKKLGLASMIEHTDDSFKKEAFKVDYGTNIERAIKPLIKLIDLKTPDINTRYLALRVLEGDVEIQKYICNLYGDDKIGLNKLQSAKHEALNKLFDCGIGEDDLKDIIAISLVRTAHNICKRAITIEKKEKKIFGIADKILTGKFTGILFMLLLLSLVFYLSLSGANYPSAYLGKFFSKLEKPLYSILMSLKIPKYISSALVYGGFRVLGFVVSVMLPPMAIFFPLFTVLEDIGYLPRIAFNLDKGFKKCKACGKQALTTCMAFGCNAAAVTGARIIDSPREKLIAIITNAMIPCNGRFPSLISIISIFLVSASFLGGVFASVYLTLFIALSVAVTLLVSRFLSETLLKGKASSFTLELPPYRKPKIGEIIVRSVVSRTIFVLARAASVAFPAGLVLYIMCNIYIGDVSLIEHMAEFLEPIGRFLGMDGALLTAFILGIPANEIVLPIALLIYTSGARLVSDVSISSMSSILISNGWTLTTAICTIVFFIFHWPCSTTLMTIKKETGSLKWTLVSFVLPTLVGMFLCMIINLI